MAMNTNTLRKQQICDLLKSIETGDEKAVRAVNESRYIQHNPQTHEGSEGLAALFKRLSETSPRVNIVRIFEDGDYIFGHTEYDFAISNVGFEIFRFEDGQAVEHWDNIQPRRGPNPSGHSMVDGSIMIEDKASTEANRELVRNFIEDVMINRDLENITHYISGEHYIEHSPDRSDGLQALTSWLESEHACYAKNHRILAEGNFVLSVCEGELDGVNTAFFDLYRIFEEKLVEHWDTVEAIPPRGEWKNDNGKF